MCAVDQLTSQVILQAVIRVEVQSFLGEFVEEAHLVDGAFTSQTGVANTVHTATVFGQGGQHGGDGADVLGRAVQVAVGDGCTGSVDTLRVDVAVVQQRHIFIHLHSLAHVLGHVDGRGQRHEELFLAGFNQSLLEPQERGHLIGCCRVNARLSTCGGGAVLQRHFLNSLDTISELLHKLII